MSICDNCSNYNDNKYAFILAGKSAVVTSCSLFFAGLERYITITSGMGSDNNIGGMGLMIGAGLGVAIVNKLDNFLEKQIPDRKCRHIESEKTQRHLPQQKKSAEPATDAGTFPATSPQPETEYIYTSDFQRSCLFELSRQMNIFTDNIKNFQKQLKGGNSDKMYGRLYYPADQLIKEISNLNKSLNNCKTSENKKLNPTLFKKIFSDIKFKEKLETIQKTPFLSEPMKKSVEKCWEALDYIKYHVGDIMGTLLE